MTKFRPADLSLTAWALSRLHVVPPRPWLASFLVECYERLHAFTPQVGAGCVMRVVIGVSIVFN